MPARRPSPSRRSVFNVPHAAAAPSAPEQGIHVFDETDTDMEPNNVEMEMIDSIRMVLEKKLMDMNAVIAEQTAIIKSDLILGIHDGVSRVIAEGKELRAENERLKTEQRKLYSGVDYADEFNGDHVMQPPLMVSSPPQPAGDAKLLERPNQTRRQFQSSFGTDADPSVPSTSRKRSSIMSSKVGDSNELEDKKKKKAEGPATVFADASAMKDKIRQAVSRKEYNVSDFYWETGIARTIATNGFFDNFTIVVIAFNALWIAIDTDNNKADLLLDADPVFVIAENLFCTYFAFEWLVRFCAFRRKRDGLRDMWFCFDSALVFMMVMETWVLTAIFWALGGSNSGVGGTQMLKLVRLVRLTRMARMARLLRAVPELIILIKGIGVASRSVIFTLLLLVIIMYFFAIVFRQIVSDLTEPDAEPNLTSKYFASVPRAMFSLLLEGIIPDMATIIEDCWDQSFVLGALVLIFTLLASLTVMNMLVGVLCEVVSVVSCVEKEQLTVSYVKTRLLAIFAEFGTTGVDGEDLLISKTEFDKLLMEPGAARILQEMGVDAVGLVDFSDYIFKDGADLSFPDFMELVLALRGSNNSTVKDIVDLRRYVLKELSSVNTTVSAISSTVQKINKAIALNSSTQRLAAGHSPVGGGAVGRSFPPSPPGRITDGHHAADLAQGQPVVRYRPLSTGPKLRVTSNVAEARDRPPSAKASRPQSALGNRAVTFPDVPPAKYSSSIWGLDIDDPSGVELSAAGGGTGGTVGHQVVSHAGSPTVVDDERPVSRAGSRTAW